VLAALAIVAAVRAAPRVAEHERRPLRIHVRAVARGRLRPLLVGIGAFELAHVAATLLILRAVELLEPEHGHDDATLIGLGLYAGFNLAAALVAVPGGHVSDRRGPVRVLVLSALAFLLAWVGFAAVGASILLLAVLFVVAGAGVGLGETATSAAVAAYAPAELRGSAFGLVAAVQAFANMAASAVAGLLWTLVSPEAAFLYLAGWSVVAVAAFLAGR
jgi:MFS family permease